MASPDAQLKITTYLRKILIVFNFILIIISQAHATDLASRLKMIGINNPSELKDFVEKLQSDIRKHDIRAIADIVRIPLITNKDHVRTVITSRENFIEKYDDIFDQNVYNIIECQDINHLGATSEGAVIGNGTVYINLYFLGDPGKYDSDKDEDTNDRSIWQLKVVTINDSRDKNKLESCQNSLKFLGH